MDAKCGSSSSAFVGSLLQGEWWLQMLQQLQLLIIYMELLLDVNSCREKTQFQCEINRIKLSEWGKKFCSKNGDAFVICRNEEWIYRFFAPPFKHEFYMAICGGLQHVTDDAELCKKQMKRISLFILYFSVFFSVFLSTTKKSLNLQNLNSLRLFHVHQFSLVGCDSLFNSPTTRPLVNVVPKFA